MYSRYETKKVVHKRDSSERTFENQDIERLKLANTENQHQRKENDRKHFQL